MDRHFIRRGAVSIEFILMGLLITVISSTAAAEPLQAGDVLVGGNNGNIYQYRNQSNIRTLTIGEDTTQQTIYGLCFSPEGAYLYATSARSYSDTHDRARISRFNNEGTLLASSWASDFPSDSYPNSCVVDASGNIYVGVSADRTQSPSIREYGPDGTFVRTLYVQTDVMGYGYIDLSFDQRTLLYASKGKIKRFDVISNTQLEDFADVSVLASKPTLSCSAVRVRRNGADVVAVCYPQEERLNAPRPPQARPQPAGGDVPPRTPSPGIVRLGSNGQIIEWYKDLDTFRAISFAPLDRDLWATTSTPEDTPEEITPLSRAHMINIKTGQEVISFTTEIAIPLAVYKERSVRCWDLWHATVCISPSLRVFHFSINGRTP